MNLDMARFQGAFTAALFNPGEPSPAIAELVSQPAFTVYRNTVMKGCGDALEANFPSVVRLVGAPWFRAVALDYATWQPPDDASLLNYGRSFPDFLELCAAARELSYLSGVARLDRYWIESHVAGEADCDPSFLAALAPEELGATAVAPHPAARWRWFPEQPIYTIWSRNRTSEAATGGLDLQWHGEGALLTRPGDPVLWRAASQGECVFLDACAVPGATLAGTAAATLALQADIDLARLLAGLLGAGALVFPNRNLNGDAP
jgi:hypothetical protein